MESEVITQVDFSGGQINASASRRDDIPTVATGGLAFPNFRAEAQGTALTRPGRAALYFGPPRTEFVRMSGAATFHVSFTTGTITITDTLGNVVATSSSASYLWTNATVAQISFAAGLYWCCICYPGMQPVVLTWAPSTSTWSFGLYVWNVIGGNRQEPFFRFSVLGASMSWSTTTSAYLTVGASLPLTCSQPYFTNAMIGSVLSILGGQVQITAVGSVGPITTATVTVLTRLPDTVTFSGVNPTGFVVGQVAASTLSGLKIEVGNVGATTVTGILMSGRIMPTVGGSTTDTISSPTASVSTSGFTLFNTGATETVQWSEEFMSSVQGWPASVSFGNDRFIFCQFPQRQEAILWTAIGQIESAYIDSAAAATDQSAGSSASSAILEFIDNRPKVLNVVDTGDEFIFTDHGVWFIPLAVSGTPLKPGSVAFRQITNDGCSAVRPIPLLQSVIYSNAAGNRISVVRATGMITLPYSSDDITDVHSNLFNNPVCIAVSAGDQSPERLCYVVNANGSIVIGKFARTAGIVGWHPETGVGSVKWVTTDIQNVWYNTSYSGGNVVELETPTDFLDCTMAFNAPPANMVNGALGPFWWLPLGLVTLSDQGVDYGDRSLDANGNIIQLQGDVLTSPTMVGGAPITKSFSPVIKHAGPGTDRRQRMRRRSIKNALIVVEANCEFDWGSLRVSSFQFGVDATIAPPMRLMTIRTKPMGRSYEPSITLTSSRYGQLRIKEFSAEVTA